MLNQMYFGWRKETLAMIPSAGFGLQQKGLTVKVDVWNGSRYSEQDALGVLFRLPRLLRLVLPVGFEIGLKAVHISLEQTF